MPCSRDPKLFPFLQLPLELREQIYRYTLLGFMRSESLTFHIDVSILQTCKQIHFEARPCLYDVNVFQIALELPARNYTPWPIKSVNRPFLSRVQHLDLVWDSRQPAIKTLKKLILQLRRICMALMEAGTKLQSLKLTIACPTGTKFSHMPLGIYPLWSAEPDAFAPLKELRVRRVTVVCDFSEETSSARAYFDDVKEILEGHKEVSSRTGPIDTKLDLEVIMRREIFSYASALQVGPWHPWWEADGWRDTLEEARLLLGEPANAKTECLNKLELAPILALLENVYRARVVEWKEFGISTPLKIAEAREWMLARPEIEKMTKSVGLVDPQS